MRTPGLLENINVEEFLIADRPLEMYADCIHLLSHVGDDIAIQAAVAASFACRIGETLSVAIIGPPATGKSDIVKRVRDITPKEGQWYTTRMTKQSLYYIEYLGEDFLKNKLLIVSEYDGLMESSLAVRSILSEGELRLFSSFTKTEIVVNGPTCLLFTDTKNNFEQQFESRLLKVTTDGLRSGHRT